MAATPTPSVMSPTVSVIVPTYNDERTLAACLDAIRAQTHRPVEILVADDASTDATTRIATDYGCTLLTTERNRGRSAARNRGASASTGEILFFVDSDTAVEADAIANAVGALRQGPGYGGVHGIRSAQPLFGDGPVARYQLLHGHYWQRCNVGPMRTMFFKLAAMPKAVFTEIGPLEENPRDSEDMEEFSNRLAARYPILMSADVIGRHDAENKLFPLLRRQFRSTQRMAPGVALRGAPGVRVSTRTGILAAGLFACTAPLTAVALPFVALPLAMLVLFAFADPGLSRFVWHEKGVAFLVYFTAVHFLVHLVIVAGAAFGVLRLLVDPNFGPSRPATSDPPSPTDLVSDGSIHSPRWSHWAISGALMAGVLLAIWLAFRDQDWRLASTLLRPHAVPYLLAACLANLTGLWLAMLSWRQLLNPAACGMSRAVSAHIYFVGVLAQKLPGRIWGMLTHIRLGRSAGFTTARMVSGYTLSVPVSLMTASVIGSGAAPVVLGGWAVLLVAPVLLAVGMFARPQAVNLLVGRLGTLVRRPLPEAVVSPRAMRRSIAAAFACWLVFGLHLWVLAVLLGAPPLAALPVCVSGFALAMVVGSLAIFLPDGWGVREVALVIPLATVLPLPAAAIAAVASRLVTFVTELLGALVAVLFARIATGRAHTPELSDTRV